MGRFQEEDFRKKHSNKYMPTETFEMSSHNQNPKPQISEKLPEHIQEQSTSPRESATKKPKLASKPPANVDEPFTTTNTPEYTDPETLLSPGHAPGYLQWRRALAPDLASETEEEKKQRVSLCSSLLFLCLKLRHIS